MDLLSYLNRCKFIPNGWNIWMYNLVHNVLIFLFLIVCFFISGCGMLVFVFICVVIAYRRKSTESSRVLKSMQEHKGTLGNKCILHNLTPESIYPLCNYHLFIHIFIKVTILMGFYPAIIFSFETLYIITIGVCVQHDWTFLQIYCSIIHFFDFVSFLHFHSVKIG